MPAGVFKGAQEEWLGEGGKKDSLGWGTSGLVGWVSGYHDHRGHSPPCLLRPAPRLLQNRCNGSPEKGEFPPAHTGEKLLRCETQSSSQIWGLAVTLNYPGFSSSLSLVLALLPGVNGSTHDIALAGTSASQRNRPLSHLGLSLLPARGFPWPPG